jgi:hypothetical protein
MRLTTLTSATGTVRGLAAPLLVRGRRVPPGRVGRSEGAANPLRAPVWPKRTVSVRDYRC